MPQKLKKPLPFGRLCVHLGLLLFLVFGTQAAAALQGGGQTVVDITAVEAAARVLLVVALPLVLLLLGLILRRQNLLSERQAAFEAWRAAHDQNTTRLLADFDRRFADLQNNIHRLENRRT